MFASVSVEEVVLIVLLSVVVLEEDDVAIRAAEELNVALEVVLVVLLLLLVVVMLEVELIDLVELAFLECLKLLVTVRDDAAIEWRASLLLFVVVVVRPFFKRRARCTTLKVPSPM